jgi:hypothetical protein
MSIGHARLVVAVLAALTAGCQLKSASSVPPNFITVDPKTFVLHSVDRYNDPMAGSDSMIVVIKATYTNQEAIPQHVGPDKFTLLDPTLMAVYYGLNGGGVDIPSMAPVSVDPGKTTEIAVGFRVPASMSGARLTYHE